MIGNIIGEVLFSDGQEAILMTNSGIGYQIFCNDVLVEGSVASLFIGHIIKETDEDLYAFKTLREKKMFELLISVKGVGPKSAFSLLSSLGVVQIISAVTLENKKILTTAPGIGNKAASQMLLDLCGKVQKINMYTNNKMKLQNQLLGNDNLDKSTEVESLNETMGNDQKLIDETLMACSELGFKEELVIPIAQKIMRENLVGRPEQLVHLVLKEL